MQDFNIFQFASVLLIIILLVRILWGVIYRGFWQDVRLSRQRAKEFKANISSGVVGEPHILRDLETLEREILIRDHRFVYQWMQITQFTFPLTVAMMVVIVYFGLVRDLLLDDNFRDFLLIIVGLFVLQVGLIWREQNLYKDLRSPVFRVNGELLKTIEGFGRSKQRFFVVRGVKFGSSENPQVDGYWDKWRERESIAVEYSPWTKHIWKIMKV